MRADWRELLVFPASILALAVWIATGDGWSRTVAAFLLGATVTLLLVGWTLGFDAHSLRWRWGAAGEQWTAEELEKLGSEWRIFHDIPDGGRNWDHVVVGPAGVFAIDSKNLTGHVTVDDTGLRTGRLRDGGAATRGSAVRLKEAIEHRAAVALWVQGVVAVWGDLRDAVERDRVLYVPGTQIAEALAARPRRLSDQQIDRAAAAIESLQAERSA